MRVCFVCSGNICRSPTAEVVLRRLARERRLDGRVIIDSAGTGDWHAGDDMDGRSRDTLHRHGYDADAHCAKQFTPADFADRDLVIALDRGHERWLRAAARYADDPAAARARIRLLRSYDPDAVVADDLDVGDPYYGGAEGFVTVLRQIERACTGLLREIADFE